MKQFVCILLLFISFHSKSQSPLFVRYTPIDSFSVYFPTGKADILEKKTLINRLKRLPKDSCYFIKITGYTDTIGSVIYNRNLSSNRMKAVLNQLIQQKLNVITIDSVNMNEGKSKKNTQAPEQLRRVDCTLYTITETIKCDAIYDLSISFRPGTDLILLESYPILEQIAEILNKNKSLNIELGGHVCCDDNYPLSLNRAKKVEFYLIKHGIAPERVTSQGYSNKRPKVKEVNAQTEQINRRVELIFRK